MSSPVETQGKNIAAPLASSKKKEKNITFKITNEQRVLKKQGKSKSQKKKKFHHRRQPTLFFIVSVILPTNFAGQVNPLSIATPNAKKIHLFHHRAVLPGVGGPVGRAGRDPTSLRAFDSLDF